MLKTPPGWGSWVIQERYGRRSCRISYPDAPRSLDDAESHDGAHCRGGWVAAAQYFDVTPRVGDEARRLGAVNPQDIRVVAGGSASRGIHAPASECAARGGNARARTAWTVRAGRLYGSGHGSRGVANAE